MKFKRTSDTSTFEPRNQREHELNIKMRPVIRTLLMMVLMLLPMNALRAQLAGSGAIQGRVTDPSGAVIPQVTVTAVETSTGVSTIRTSTAAGIYTISPLEVGQYTVMATAAGFATAVQEHVQVNATQAVGLDFKMTIGQQTEKVTVTSAPPELQTTDATLSEVMSGDTYEALPLIMNQGPLDPTAFVTLMNGVSNIGRSGVFNGGGGSSGQSDEIYMDGVPLTEDDAQGDNRSVQLGVSIDSISQFQVVMSSPSVQYGGMGATNWNIKGGTNKYHGSVYAAFRNTAFDAWGYFAPAATISTLINGMKTTVPAPKPAEHQDEQSYTVGGPIRIPRLFDGRDKLFFFASYVRYHQTRGVNPSVVSVPTALERAGNFTQLSYPIFDPTTTTSTCAVTPSTCSNKQFMGMVNGVPTPNVIPTSEISPQAQYMQSFLPAAQNQNTDQNNLLSGSPLGNINWTFNGRIDYQFSPKQRFSFVSSGGVRQFVPCDGCGPLPIPYGGAAPGFDGLEEKVDTDILEHDYTISEHAVNNFRYAYNRFWDYSYNLTGSFSQYAAGPGGIGIGNLPPGESTTTWPSTSFSGNADVPTGWGDNASNVTGANTYDIVDNLILAHGKHNTTFGFVFQWLNSNISSHETETAPLGLGFSNVSTAGYNAAGTILNTTTGNPYASFLLGAVNGTTVTEYPYSTLGARYKAFSPYVQDDFRVTPKLALNLGLRWDLFTPFTERENRWSFFNPLLNNPATGTLGAMEFAGVGPDTCQCRTPIQTYFGNVGPRIGLAYSINSKTIFRAGFATEYTHTGGVGGHGGSSNGTGQTGLTATAVIPTTGQSGAIPAYYLNNSAYFQSIGLASNALPAYTATAFANPMVNSGNFINTGVYPLAATGAAVTAQGVSYGDLRVGGRAGYSEELNVGVQRALTNDLTVEVDLTGSESHFLVGGSRGAVINQLNPMYESLGAILQKLPSQTDAATNRTYLADVQAAFPGTGLPFSNFGGPNATVQAMLESFPQYGGISDTFGVVGNANYQSIQVKLSQRPWHGLNYTVNYTYSKLVDDTGTFRSGWPIPGYVMSDGISRPMDRTDRGLSTSDSPQILHIYGVWNLPFGHGKNHLLNAVTGGWSFSSIFSYVSGGPLAITASGCKVIGQGTCMPAYTNGYSHSPRMNGGWGSGITAASAGSHSYVDATAFTVLNQTYQIGNVPRTAPYNLFGPSPVLDLDSGISRTFKITEKGSFVFNANCTNVTNDVRWGISSNTVTAGAVTTAGQNPVGTNTNSSFSTIGSQSNSARDWQFAGRINF